MENVLTNKVIAQQVQGMDMEDYIASMLEQMDQAEIDKQRAEMKIQFLKQLNNRHKNIIDAQRVINKSLELELTRLTGDSNH